MKTVNASAASASRNRLTSCCARLPLSSYQSTHSSSAHPDSAVLPEHQGTDDERDNEHEAGDHRPHACSASRCRASTGAGAGVLGAAAVVGAAGPGAGSVSAMTAS